MGLETPVDRDFRLDVATVATVYRSALETPPWQRVAEMLCDRMDAMMMAISFRLVIDGLPSIGIQAFRGSGRQLWDTYHARFPGLRTFDMDLAKPGRILALSECDPPEPEALARLRAECFAPLGAGEAYCLAIGDDAAPNTYLIWIKQRGADITSEEREWLLDLAPHLERAIEGYYQTRQAQLACGVLSRALDRLSVGVAAIDRSDQILFSNAIADDILAHSPDIGGHAHRLTVHSPRLRRKLEDARIAPQAMRIAGPAGQSIGMVVMAAEGRDELGPRSRPERAIYFHRLSPNADVPERLVAELYDLSLSEAKLCVLLVNGLTLRECAERMNITENTARTYSKQVFSKIGINRQVDLVREMLHGLAILAQGEVA